jgi:hypothetical protein
MRDIFRYGRNRWNVVQRNLGDISNDYDCDRFRNLANISVGEFYFVVSHVY